MYLASHKMDTENGADPDQTPQNVASDQVYTVCLQEITFEIESKWYKTPGSP